MNLKSFTEFAPVFGKEMGKDKEYEQERKKVMMEFNRELKM